jgi:hypothetical protein
MTGDSGSVWRWSLQEYLLRCEIGKGLCEVIVEGGLDRDVFEAAVQRWGYDDVTIIDSAFLSIDNGEVVEAGFEPGVKGQLLTLGRLVTDASSAGRVQATIVIVVDRDYSDAVFGPRIFVTDGYSIENYLMDVKVLDTFVRLTLGRGISGANERRTTSGQELCDAILGAACAISAVRRLVRRCEPPAMVFDRWLDYVQVEADGSLVADSIRLLRNVLGAQGRDQVLERVRELQTEESRVEADAFRLVRGHDFVSLLVKLLRSRWGRGIAGIYRRADEDTLARALFAAADPQQIDCWPLFRSVRSALAP